MVDNCEFGAVKVLKQLDVWHWDYVLRQKGHIHIYHSGQMEWRDFGSRVEKPGRSICLGKGWLTQSRIYPVNIPVRWKVGKPEQ
jgi:hypothetical protein